MGAIPADAFLTATSDKCETRSVFDKLEFHQLLQLLKMPEEVKTTKELWTHLTGFHDEDDSRSAFLDLFFQYYFTGRLFFDADNLPKRSSDSANFATAIKIENYLESSGLTIPEKRYCVALVHRLKGATLESAYRGASPDTQMTDPSSLNKQGRLYCQRAIKVVADKMGIIVDANRIKGKA